jgi:hypothetical protein
MPINSSMLLQMATSDEPLILGCHLLAEDHRPFDIDHITKISITSRMIAHHEILTFLTKLAGPRTLLIDNVRLATGVSWTGSSISFALGEWSAS